MMNTSRIVFIDTNVANYQDLISQLPVDSEVVKIHAEQDSVVQMLAALKGKVELDAIDIISHGKPGALMLGSGELNRTNLTPYAEQLVQLGSYLKEDGDILLYGCEVAQGKHGQAFIEQLAQLTGANIAASTSLTGAEDLGGDWVLAARAGMIQSSTLQLSYHGVLANIIGTADNNILAGSNVADTLTGGSGDDILYGGGGNDVAIFLGNQTDFKFSLNPGGQVIVQDINPADGDEGTDTLTDIQTLRFADGDITNSATVIFKEFRVNTTTAFGQSEPSIATLNDGGFVVTWTSGGNQDGSGFGIYAQRYGAQGAKKGSEFRVNTTTNLDQVGSSITTLSNGDFVVTWTSNGQDGSGKGIYAQRFDSNGVKLGGEFRVNTYTSLDQEGPSITALSGGGFVITWSSAQQDSSDYGVFAQRYDADGVPQGDEFQINTTTDDNQNGASITALVDGGFVATWTSWGGQDGSLAGVYGQRYDANGVAQGNEFQINTHTNLYQTGALSAALTGGGYVVTWTSGDNSESGVYAQRYDSNGIALGTEFRVNTYITPQEFQGNQSAESIAALANGGFVITWSSYEQDSAEYGIFAQRFDANGVAQDGEFRVNTYTTTNQTSSSTTALHDGGFVVTWTSFAQDKNSDGVYAQRYDANGRAVGDFTLTGSANADHLTIADSMKTSVKLLGLAGDDVLQSGAGNDTLDGGIGNDILTGGSGADTMLGGAGSDNYFVENTGDVVIENLNQGIDSVNSRLTYSLSANVENLALSGTSVTNGTGNGLGNMITGNSAVNHLSGGAGNDILDGRYGNNVLTGGAGKDIFKFTTKGHTDTITDYNVVSDTIQLENAVFTALTITGTLAANQFRVGAKALDANDFIIYNNVTGALRYDADGSGAGASVQIATVGIGLNLTNADVVVI